MKRSTKFYRKNEAEVMKRLGFYPVVNSGAGWIGKEDGESDKMLCQLKSTDKESISIKQHDLHTLEIHAAESHKLPVFAFQFLNRDEVWLAVKESDIEAFKSILMGEEMYYPKCFGEYEIGKCDCHCTLRSKCREQKEQIDEIKEIGYNYNASGSSIREAIEARKRFYRESQKEKEETEKRFKEKAREKRNRCRKKK